VYGKITGTNAAASPTLQPANFYFQLPGSGVFSDAFSLRGLASSVNVSTGAALIATDIQSYPNVTNRLVQILMLPSSISGVSGTNNWEFNFTCSYKTS
jgi:hypothetical protein